MRRFAEGVRLPSLFGGELQFGATLQAAVDGKAKAQLQGTKKSVSATTERICCNCNVTSSQRHLPFNFLDPSCPLLLTTTESLKRDASVLASFTDHSGRAHGLVSKLLGVCHHQNAFVGIVPGMPFQCVEFTPYDHLMHGEAEGLLKAHLQKFLNHLFDSKPSDAHYHRICLNGNASLGEASFNELVSFFPYNEDDRHHKPKRLKPKALKPENGITWTASMMLVFAVHSCVLLGPYVDSTDPCWTCWCLHCYYVAYALKDSFTWDEIVHLNDLILRHHELLNAHWPDVIIPKFHWVLHIALDIWLNGPPRHISCMRYEAAHQFWKRLGKKVNFKGSVPATLATRRSRHVAFKKYIAKPKQRVVSFGSVMTSNIDTSMPLSALHQDLLRFKPQDSKIMQIKTHKKWQYCGHFISNGSCILYEDEDELPIVGVALSLVQIGDHFLIEHAAYASGIVDFEEWKCPHPLKAILLDSVEFDSRVVELNTQKLSFITCIPYQNFGLLVI